MITPCGRAPVARQVRTTGVPGLGEDAGFAVNDVITGKGTDDGGPVDEPPMATVTLADTVAYWFDAVNV
jgi:hypothetical protein